MGVVEVRLGLPRLLAAVEDALAAGCLAGCFLVVGVVALFLVGAFFLSAVVVGAVFFLFLAGLVDPAAAVERRAVPRRLVVASTSMSSISSSPRTADAGRGAPGFFDEARFFDLATGGEGWAGVCRGRAGGSLRMNDLAAGRFRCSNCSMDATAAAKAASS